MALLYWPDLGTSPYPDISTIEINTSGIVKLLNELDPSKSSGPDKIPPKLLKLLADGSFTLPSTPVLCFFKPRYCTSRLEESNCVSNIQER